MQYFQNILVTMVTMVNLTEGQKPNSGERTIIAPKCVSPNLFNINSTVHFPIIAVLP